MQMQHFNHNIWEKHIFPFPHVTQKPLSWFFWSSSEIIIFGWKLQTGNTTQQEFVQLKDCWANEEDGIGDFNYYLFASKNFNQ